MRQATAALTLVVLVSLGVAAGRSASPLRPAHYPLSFTGMVSGHRDRDVSGGRETNDWSVPITLKRTSKNDSRASYEGTGTVHDLTNGTCCGGCSYTAGPADFPVEVTLLIQRSTTSPTGFEYDLRGGSAVVQVPWHIQCPVSAGNDPPTISTSVGWAWTAPYPGPQLTGRYTGETTGAKGVVRWKLQGKPDPDELMADAGGPYKVPRAGRVTLNGAGSTGKIVSYKWHVGPAAGCHGTLKTTTKAGPTWGFVALCSLHVTLTVTDRERKTDSASTTVQVVPREAGFRIPPVQHTEDPSDRRVDDLPFVHPGAGYGITFGANVSKCGPKTGIAAGPQLCPPWGASGGKKTGRGGRYTLAKVHDAGGPFDGFTYVGSAPITIERIGLLNPYFLPGGPRFLPNQPSIWDYNTAHGVSVNNSTEPVDMAGLVAAMHAHEGMGLAGRLSTGHSGRLQAWVKDPDGDPRQQIEDRFGTDQQAVQDEVDRELGAIELTLFQASKDPLPVIWTGQMWFYDREDGVWRQEEMTVGGSTPG